MRDRQYGLSLAAGIARILLCALLPVAAPGAQAADTSFRLRAGLDQLPAYFPGLLGNGYIATPTVPRGTEAAQTYLVGFMDYSPGDVSRPALVPGWTEMDFAPGASGSNQEWVNEAPLVAAHFANYRQTLALWYPGYTQVTQAAGDPRARSLWLSGRAEIAIAQGQYYLATLDRNWLRTRGWPVISDVARY